MGIVIFIVRVVALSPSSFRKTPFHRSKTKRALRTSVDILRSNHPPRIYAQPAIRSLKHQAGVLIALQLPVQPSNGNAAELAPVWLTICAAMSDSSFITAKYGNGRNAIEIVVSVYKGDVFSIAADICHRRVERL